MVVVEAARTTEVVVLAPVPELDVGVTRVPAPTVPVAAVPLPAWEDDGPPAAVVVASAPDVEPGAAKLVTVPAVTL